MGNMTSENEPDASGESEEQRQSKSARKRDAASLQELGVKLSALPDQEIKALDLPDSLFVALRDLRRLPSHGAQIRQRQYIGIWRFGISNKSSAGATGCCRNLARGWMSFSRNIRIRTAPR